MTMARKTCLLALILAVVPTVNAWTTSTNTGASSNRHADLLRDGPAIAPVTQRRLKPLNAAEQGFEDTTSKKTESKTIYSMPALYDLAFGYRDFEEETDFLLDRHCELVGRPVQRVLELAAGPARHSITALLDHPILSANCIDLSTDMAAYAKQVATEKLGDNSDSLERFHYQVDDMRNFEIDCKVDTAWILLGSLQHLTKNSDVIECFQSVHRALQKDGTVFLELPHPRETFSMVDCTRNGWKVPLELASEDDDDDNEQEESSSGGGELSIIWGDDGDSFDPVTQVRQFTIKMELTGVDDKDSMQSVQQVVPLRLFTAQEIDALARCAGFQVVAMYGALEEGVGVNDGDAAFRLICVLRKQ